MIVILEINTILFLDLRIDITLILQMKGIDPSSLLIFSKHRV